MKASIRTLWHPPPLPLPSRIQYLQPNSYFCRAISTSSPSSRPQKTQQELKDEALPFTDIKHLPSFPASSVPPPPVEAEPILPPLLEPEPEQTVPQPAARIRRPIGAFRGGLIGFLLATTLAGTYGYFTLLTDYTKASEVLLLSVEELKESTTKLTKHINRIEKVEAQLDDLVKTVAKKNEVDSLRNEYKKLIEAEHLDLLALKAHIWGVEQDLDSLSKRKSNQIRI